MRIAVLFHRFGPYHWARLQAAGESADVVGVELSAETNEYAWDVVDGDPAFERVTVWQNGDIRDLNVSHMRRLVEETLDHIAPDVVAIHGWAMPDALAASSWCMRAQVPTVLMSDSTAHDFERVWWKEKIKRGIVDTFQAAFVAGQLHTDYLTRLGMSPSKIFQGYDVVDNAHFEEGTRSARASACEMRDEFSLPARYFLASARFVSKKNLPRLIDAFAAYRSEAGTAAWDLVLLGDGPERSAVESAVKRNRVRSAVHLPGFKQYDELPVYYGLAEAFIHASTREQWGLVVNEAMASGLPVLVSERCGCVPDLVHEGQNGFTFDPYDVAELAGLMTRMAEDRCDRLAMGACSRDIISHWAPERFANGLLAAAKKAKSSDMKHAWTVTDTSLLWLLQRILG